MADSHAGEDVEFSAVISCYREEHSIREFHRRLRDTLVGLGRSFEIVYVNDGSRDGTLATLLELYAEDPSVGTIVDLLRNSGSAAAVAAGCAAARGRHFIFLDSDLQLDPEDLPSLMREFDRSVDLVNGVRRHRRDPWWRTMLSGAFHRTLRVYSGTALLDPFCTFKIARGELVRGLAPGPHRVMNPVHLAAAAGTCADVPVAHHGRPHGSSNWTVAGLLALALDTVVGSARYPFQVVGLVGVGFASFAVIGVGLSALFSDSGGLGFLLVLVGLAVNLCALFLIGEYLVRVHRAVQGLPRYIVRSTWQRERNPGAPSVETP